jgi:hypothetical protein
MIGGLLYALGGLERTLDDRLPGHGEYLSALILGLLMVDFLRRWKSNKTGWMGSILLGLGIGVAFHLQPGLLPVIVGFLLFEL